MLSRLQPFARMAVWFAVGGIAVLSLVPGQDRPHTDLPGPFEHMAAYALTGVMVATGYSAVLARVVWWGALTLAASAFEGLQNVVPGRTPAITDAVASSTGAALGIAVGALLLEALARATGARAVS